MLYNYQCPHDFITTSFLQLAVVVLVQEPTELLWGGVQEPCRCGTEGHGLVGMVGMSHDEMMGQLDSMILEVFSNLNDAMIL